MYEIIALSEVSMRLSRQNKILEIIKTNEVETQDQLQPSERRGIQRDPGYCIQGYTRASARKGSGKDGKHTDILRAITMTVLFPSAS